MERWDGNGVVWCRIFWIAMIDRSAWYAVMKWGLCERISIDERPSMVALLAQDVNNNAAEAK